jgi:uncharacterized protein YecE (DUF72 family)
VTWRVGTSGWQYASWRGPFYPEKLPQSQWLEHYAQQFATVEVDNTFYRLPEAETFGAWASRTPADFTVALKASRYLTHIRRLREPRDPVATLMGRIDSLGDKLGPVLLQLPPTLRIEPERLAETLAAFPDRVRVAVEFRHDSWYADPIERLLADRGAALCIPDRAGKALSPLWRTAAWAYIRFHEGRAAPAPCYGPRALHSWIQRIRSLWDERCDVFVYFNNDGHCCAVRDAREFARLAAREGLRVTRVPEAPIRV